MISESEWEVPTELVPSVRLDMNGMARVPIHEGWNIIGNVFSEEVAWEDVLNANPFLETSTILWQYNRGFAESEVLKQYAGYYFFNSNPDEDTLSIPFPGFLQASAPLRGLSKGNEIDLKKGVFSL